ncbi:hypothetical protein [Rhodococcus sp. NPDC060084]|uniref:hypothetical protein n=1 Tax=Rhodococcus sp. NPDC060084 TaxID=3347053 RepID=UPI003649A693
MQIDLQPGPGQVGDRSSQRGHDRQHIHIGSQALRMDTDDERVRRAVRRVEPVPLEHVRVRQDRRGPSPAGPDSRGSAGGEGDQFPGRRYQHVEVLQMRARGGVVRVSQVVHGVDEGDPVGVEGADDLLEHFGFHRVEPEVDVEDVEFIVVIVDPSGLEHHRWPPSTGDLSSVGGYRVGQPDHSVVAVG